MDLLTSQQVRVADGFPTQSELALDPLVTVSGQFLNHVAHVRFSNPKIPQSGLIHKQMPRCTKVAFGIAKKLFKNAKNSLQELFLCRKR